MESEIFCRKCSKFQEKKGGGVPSCGGGRPPRRAAGCPERQNPRNRRFAGHLARAMGNLSWAGLFPSEICKFTRVLMMRGTPETWNHRHVEVRCHPRQVGRLRLFRAHVQRHERSHQGNSDIPSRNPSAI